LEAKWLTCTEGTIVDATIVNAPSSTKNKDRSRDPEMHSTQKWKQYYFGMKTHIGVDKKNGLVHTLACTSAEIHDSQMMDQLLHWEEKEIYGDGGYADKEKANAAIFSGKFWLVCRRAYRNRPLTQDDKNWNKFCSAIRSKIEWVFWVIKDLRWHRKVRYRWIHKNEMQRYMLCGLTNAYRMRQQLLS
jgi:IS5 family transposase